MEGKHCFLTASIQYYFSSYLHHYHHHHHHPRHCLHPVKENLLSYSTAKYSDRYPTHFCNRLFQYGFNLKAPIMTAADDIHKIFFHCFSEKIRLDVSSESSARQRIHMKNQALISLKDKTNKSVVCCNFVWHFKG